MQQAWDADLVQQVGARLGKLTQTLDVFGVRPARCASARLRASQSSTVALQVGNCRAGSGTPNASPSTPWMVCKMRASSRHKRSSSCGES
jgi:hypothetical protein